MIKQNLSLLEERSIFLLREAVSRFDNVAALWSMGKDSTAMLAVARKAFVSKIPFPVIHIDNGIDFPETYEFRDLLTKKWKLDLIVAESIQKYRDELDGQRGFLEFQLSSEFIICFTLSTGFIPERSIMFM